MFFPECEAGVEVKVWKIGQEWRDTAKTQETAETKQDTAINMNSGQQPQSNN